MADFVGVGGNNRERSNSRNGHRRPAKMGSLAAIPQNKILGLPPGLFAEVPDSVVVVDTGNYYPRQRDGRIDGIENGMLESRWVEQQRGRPVVKAFNDIYARHLLELGQPAGSAGRIALPVGDTARFVIYPTLG